MPSLQLAPLLKTLMIQDKRTARVIPFPLDGNDEFAWAQRGLLRCIEQQYNAGKPVRVIVLKARQLGISTVAAAVLYWWAFLHPGTDGLVITHQNDVSLELFEKTKMFWEMWPYRDLYTVKNSTQRRLTWMENRSSLRIATAKNLHAGRGFTLHAVHASECAYYPNPEPLFLGLEQTMPTAHGTIVIAESTANGIGNYFHDQWLRAETGDTDYVPLFFPYWKHPEYRLHTSLASLLELNAEERRLIHIGASYQNVEWRRWALRNKCNNDEQFFMQEYPSTPEEAFLSTGTNVFPLRKLDECYVPIRGHRGMLVSADAHGNNPKYVPEPTGPLYVYKAPTKNDRRTDRYFVSGDPSMTIKGDPACIQVINRATMEQVAVWHGKINPIDFAREMMLLGRWYHDAELCPEVEGGGQGTIATILNAGYPNIWQHRWADKAPGKLGVTHGWATNWQRKNWAIGQLKYLIGDNSIIIHDKKTYNQLRNYIVLPNGELGNADANVHDDAVMALSIGVTASISEGPFSDRAQNNNVFDLYGGDEEFEAV